MRGPIVLVGLMGSGKTSVGKALARRLGWRHLDLDARLERRHGLSVARQFESLGEAVFRRREAAELARCLKLRQVVLSTGGGVVVRPENRRRLKKALCLYLQASPRALAQRLDGIQAQKRPLLKGKSPYQVLVRLRAQRAPWYESVATARLRASQGNAEAVAARALARCKELC